MLFLPRARGPLDFAHPVSMPLRLCNDTLSVCLSRRSTAEATCGWFAAELGRGRQTSIDQCLPARRIPATGRYLPLAPELSGGPRRVESRGSRLNADSLYDVQIRFEPVVFVDADVDVAFRQLLVVGGTARQNRLQTTIQSAISEQIR